MKKFFPLLAILFIFILDRITKFMIVGHWAEGQSLSVWPGVFHLTRVNNTGAAFGLMKQHSFLLILISVVCVIGLLAVLVKGFFVKSYPRNVALALITAGAAGNLYDRLCFGYVIDFLDFRIWPVFNFADSAICIGIFLIILTLMKPGKNS